MEAGQAPEWTAIAMAIMIAVTACGGCWNAWPPRPDAEPSGPDAPERDTPPLCAWYPTTDAAQDRYRRIREIILEEHLGPEAAMERFAFSKRTYYRIKNGEKLEEDLGRFEGA